MCRASSALLTAIAILLPLGTSVAQETVVAGGATLRVHAPGLMWGDTVEGRFVRIDDADAADASLVLDWRPAGERIEVPLTLLERLEVADGRAYGAVAPLLGTILGAGLGAAAGLVFGEEGLVSEEDVVLIGAVVGAGGGLIAGTVLGFFVGPTRWREIQPDSLRGGDMTSRGIPLDGASAGMRISVPVP